MIINKFSKQQNRTASLFRLVMIYGNKLTYRRGNSSNESNVLSVVHQIKYQLFYRETESKKILTEANTIFNAVFTYIIEVTISNPTISNATKQNSLLYKRRSLIRS